MLRQPVLSVGVWVAAGFTVGLIGGCFTTTPPDPIYACEDGTLCPEGKVCSGGFCVEPVENCVPKTCAESGGANCDLISDGCGAILDCGDCTAPESCGGGGMANVCGAIQCTPETDPALCARYNRGCDALEAKDNCGVTRIVQCGQCPPSQACGSGGIPFQCGACTPLTEKEICQRDGLICVYGHQVNNCGKLETINCVCEGGFCVDAGQAGCCMPASPEMLCAGRCGHYTTKDNCGLQLSLECGGCPNGGSCGFCPDGGACNVNVCSACISEPKGLFCKRLGKNCGIVNEDDNCGVPRIENCGTCDPMGPQCTQANVCGCNPNLIECTDGADCCTGVCGPARLCCAPQNGECIDDSDCCKGSCALSRCVPYPDAGP